MNVLNKNMDKIQIILLQLLRLAINGENSDSLNFDSIDWKQQLQIASAHGVRNLLWYAIEKDPGIVSFLSRDEKLKWYGQCLFIQKKLIQKNRIIEKFIDCMKPYRIMILKGVDYARYWPSSTMREFGDLDCFVLDTLKGAENAKQFDRVAQERGIEYEEGNYKHSHLFYKGLMVENHHYFTGFASSKQARDYELCLRELVAEGVTQNELGAFSPNANFTALFMISHACSHFFYEGINLRFALDWLFFLQKEQDNVDWGRVYVAMEKVGTRAFADLLTAFCHKYIGWNPSNKSVTQSNDERLLQDFCNDIFSDQMNDHDRRWHMMVARMVHRFQRHWRFRKVARTSILRAVWNTLAYSSIWRRKPTLKL